MFKGIALGLGLLILASAAQAGTREDCAQDRNLDLSIRACSEIIARDRRAVWAYTNRGVTYAAKGDNDRAIADYDEAIRLSPNHAGAYTSRGVAYHAKGDNDRASADFSEAIRLNPSLAEAYNNRGAVYRATGDNDRAVADYGEAIRLNPNYANAYYNRGNAYRDRGDNDRAIADYGEAIRLNPKLAAAYVNRGRAYLYSGILANAQADFKQANGLEPKDAHAALWLDRAERRNNLPSRLKQLSAPLDMAKWPGPVVQLLLGELTPDQTLAAADHADPKTRNGQVCEANFYSGQLALLESRKDEAVRLFRLAAADCLRTFVEWGAARAELRLLGAEP